MGHERNMESVQFMKRNFQRVLFGAAVVVASTLIGRTAQAELKIAVVDMQKALTSSREGPDVEECYQLGANAYVVKPVDFTQFAEAVKTIGKFWAVLNELPRIHGRAATTGS